MDRQMIYCPRCKEKILLFMRDKENSYNTEKCPGCDSIVWIEDESTKFKYMDRNHLNPGIRDVQKND